MNRHLLPHIAALLLSLGATTAVGADDRPNFLWISCEDTSSHLGCYGCEQAVTPALDKFAREGVRFTHAFATCPVCATNRSSIITGMYPTTIGTHHMRCKARLPDHVRCFSEYLRDAGYYTTNNVKTDYNFEPPATAWNESSRRAHWRNRKPGQPFFAVFNLTVTHESKNWPRGRAHRALTRDVEAHERQDPAKLLLPPYYPDTLNVRRDWANYFENITQMDHEVAALLKQLEDDGLAESTIVFFWSDHGAGLPRAKRWLYDSGTRVPLIVRIPEALRVNGQGKPGTTTDEPVSFIDLAPTMLNLAGVTIPPHLQGRAFLGNNLSPPRDYIVGTRDRMDERYDVIRTVRDRRFRYIRNYMPWKPYAQHVSYGERNETMRALRTAAAAGTLPKAARLFMADEKPIEELYDTENDPHELENLADSTDGQHRAALQRLRAALDEWAAETGDLGLIPEPILREQEQRYGDCLAIVAQPEMRERLREIRTMLAPEISVAARRSRCEAALESEDPTVRYWAVMGVTNARTSPADDPQALTARLDERLIQLLDDPAAVVRVAAAEALCGATSAETERAISLLTRELDSRDPWVQLHAAHALDEIGTMDETVIDALQQAAAGSENEYVVRIARHALDRIATAEPR